jgi:hypothetical protein
MKLAFAAIALMLMPPPPPPPDPARLAEAVLIWRDHPLASGRLAGEARFAIRQRIVPMLTDAHVRQGGRQWFAKYRILEGYFWARISPGLQDHEQPFLECLAGRYTGMSIEEIRALRQFLSTPAGLRFWNVSTFSERDDFDCARAVFQDDLNRAEGEAWALIGARRPPPAPAMD